MTEDLRARIIEAFNTAYEPWPVEVAPTPDIVKMSRHDGHGFQGACDVCRGDVDKLADAVVSAVGSWQGLMSLLDEHWPAEIFIGDSGDEGPRIIALIRAVDAERESRLRWAEEAARLQAELDDWTTPASWEGPHEFVDGKNGPDCCRFCGYEQGDPVHEVPKSVPLGFCACISDDQATQLGPGFSRPVCAVHPPHEHVWTACPDCPNRERGPCACSGVPCCDTDRAEIAAGTPWAEGRPPNLTVSEDDAGVFEDDAAVGAEGGEPE
jgi:hypothetical protein